MNVSEVVSALRSAVSGTDSDESGVRSRFLAGAAWVGGAKLLTFPLGLAVNGLLARLLAPGDMGAYFLASSIAGIAAALAQMGLQQAVVRFVAEAVATDRPGRACAAVRVASLYTAAAAAAIGTALAVGGGEWLALRVFASPRLAELSPAIGLWIVALALQSVFAESFRGFHDVRLATIFGGLTTVVGSASLFAALYLVCGESELATVVLLSVAASGASASLAGLILYRKVAPTAAPRQLQLRKMLSFSWPVAIGLAGFIVLNEAGIWIVGAIHDEEAAAVYGAAMRLVVLVSAAQTFVNAVSQSTIPELHVQGKLVELQRMLRATATLAGLPAIGVLAVLLLAPATALDLVYGPHYREGAVILMLLGLAQLVAACTGQSGMVLTMTGHQSLVVVIVVPSALLVVAAGLALTSTHGPVAMAAVTAAGTSLINISTWIAAKRVVGVWTHLRLDFRRLAT